MTPSTPSPAGPVSQFLQQLKDLGWMEGKNFVVERRYAEGKLDRLPALAQDLVQMNVDVIVTTGSPAIRPAFDATRTIPIVMIAGSADPVGDGFAVSLARPQGNVTGVTWSAGPELVGKNLEVLRALIPGLRRVALLYDAAVSPTTARAWQDAAQRLGVSVETLIVRHPDELEGSIDAASQRRADAMYVVLGGLNYSYRQRITALALARHLPTFSTLRELPEAGGLMSYGPSLSELYRRGAIYVDKILKGTKPADLPIEQPTKFELVLNLKIAKALGLEVPRSLMLRADHLIE